MTKQAKEQPTLGNLVARLDVQKKFEALLGEKTKSFVSSVLQIANGNDKLKECDPITILNAAATAAALDLPINKDLGFAWIVPYKGKAQFQMGYKGYNQLALRSGQYQRINAIPVYKSQFKSWNPATEFLDADWEAEESGEVVGYLAYFRLHSGFEKTVYWSKEKVMKHAQKYSQSFTFRESTWQTNFDGMALKTVLKNTLSKWGVLSVELQTAQLADQAVQNEFGEYAYLDNLNTIDIAKTAEEKEKARVLEHIEKSKDLQQLGKVRQIIVDLNDDGLALAYNAKEMKLKTKESVERTEPKQ